MVWDLVSDETKGIFDDPGVGIRSLDISKDGKRMVAANSIGECFIWFWSEESEEFQSA